MKRYVYFFRTVGAPFVKIGASEFPEGRMREYAKMCPLPLEMVAQISGWLNEEARFHRHFEHLRLQGEWFREDEELLAVMERVAAGTFDMENLTRVDPFPTYVRSSSWIPLCWDLHHLMRIGTVVPDEIKAASIPPFDHFQSSRLAVREFVKVERARCGAAAFGAAQFPWTDRRAPPVFPWFEDVTERKRIVDRCRMREKRKAERDGT